MQILIEGCSHSTRFDLETISEFLKNAQQSEIKLTFKSWIRLENGARMAGKSICEFHNSKAKLSIQTPIEADLAIIMMRTHHLTQNTTRKSKVNVCIHESTIETNNIGNSTNKRKISLLIMVRKIIQLTYCDTWATDKWQLITLIGNF